MNITISHVTGSARLLPKKVFADLPQTYNVSKEEMQFYKDNGFLVIKGLIDFESLYNYKKRFIQLCNKQVHKGKMSIVKEPGLLDKQLEKPEDYVNKINDILFDDVLGTYVEHPRLLHVLSQFLGDNITAVNSMIINKPPGTDRHPPHQDLYYFPFRPADKIMAAWTAIDDVDLENGCLYVIPGSHKNNTIHEHGTIGGLAKFYHGIINEDAVAPVEKRVHFEMSPGDTIFFHPLLIHGSGANVSKKYRKSMTCHFASSDCHYIDVAGTVQDVIAKDIEQELKRREYDITFAEMWHLRSRQVKGVRCNL